jgi:uncharacterized membrane protein
VFINDTPSATAIRGLCSQREVLHSSIMEQNDTTPQLAPRQADPAAPAGFDTAMAHLYRAEMNRMTVWRQRLDVTSNWAILLTLGLTTFTLGSTAVPHYVLLLGLALVGISVLIEANRYRHLHHSKWRLHLLEVGYFNPLLRDAGNPCQDSSTSGGGDWQRMLRADLLRPRLLIGSLTAMRVRLRRNYLLLFLFVTGVWLTKLFIHPRSPQTLDEFYSRFSVAGLIPAWFVAITAPLFVIIATALALTCPPAEQLEDWSASQEGGDT